jgi:hypothetical protein
LLLCREIIEDIDSRASQFGDRVQSRGPKGFFEIWLPSVVVVGAAITLEGVIHVRALIVRIMFGCCDGKSALPSWPEIRICQNI